MEQTIYMVIDRQMSNIEDLKVYYSRLKKHDWFYDMSDYGIARKLGQKEQTALAEIANSAGGEYAKLFDSFAAHYDAIITAREVGAAVPPLPKEPT